MAPQKRGSNHTVTRQSLTYAAALVALGISLASSVQACNIPVFRYALENWAPDPYPVFVLHQGDLTAEQAAYVDQLKDAASDAKQPANLQAFAVDTQRWATNAEAPSEPDSSTAEAGQEWPPYLKEFLLGAIADRDATSPQMVALFPTMIGRPAVAWQGSLTGDNLSALVDSPLRQTIAERLLAGQSAVWVLIESGNEGADQAAFQLLQSELERLPSRLELPDRELIETDEFFRPEVAIELKVEFSALRIRRDDPQEAAFLSMLLGSESDLREFNEPIAIPIYGRGRTYFALVGNGINPEMIEENCRFLIGACSCQVKQENPGVDMLMAVDWANRVVGTAMPEIVLPELTGIGALDAAEDASPPAPAAAETEADVSVAAAPEREPAVPTTETASTTSSAPAEQAPSAPTSRFESSLLFWLLGIAGVGIAIAFGATLLMRRNLSAS